MGFPIPERNPSMEFKGALLSFSLSSSQILVLYTHPPLPPPHTLTHVFLLLSHNNQKGHLYGCSSEHSHWDGPYSHRYAIDAQWPEWEFNTGVHIACRSGTEDRREYLHDLVAAKPNFDCIYQNFARKRGKESYFLEEQSSFKQRPEFVVSPMCQALTKDTHQWGHRENRAAGPGAEKANYQCCISILLL